MLVERPVRWNRPGTAILESTDAGGRNVTGLSHIRVFIAGARITGLAKSQARKMQVRKLSESPSANFASVLASRGATTKRSAHLRNSMCKTSSPRWYRVPGHSSLSRKSGPSVVTSAGSRLGPAELGRDQKNRATARVATTRTSWPPRVQLRHKAQACGSRRPSLSRRGGAESWFKIQSR